MKQETDHELLEALGRAVLFSAEETVADSLLCKIKLWAAAVLHIPDVNAATTLDQLVEQFHSPEGSRYFERVMSDEDLEYSHSISLALKSLIDLHLIEQAYSRAEPHGAVTASLRLMRRIAESLLESGWETDLEVGKFRRQWQREGGLAAAEKKRKETSANRERLQRDFEKLLATNPRLSKKRAAEILARRPSEGSASRTIRRHLEKPPKR